MSVASRSRPADHESAAVLPRPERKRAMKKTRLNLCSSTAEELRPFPATHDVWFFHKSAQTYKSCTAYLGINFDPIVPRFFALYRETEIFCKSERGLLPPHLRESTFPSQSAHHPTQKPRSKNTSVYIKTHWASPSPTVNSHSQVPAFTICTLKKFCPTIFKGKFERFTQDLH